MGNRGKEGSTYYYRGKGGIKSSRVANGQNSGPDFLLTAMTLLRVTVIGQDLFKIAEEHFELAGLKWVNQLNQGMLGNLKTLTYTFELEEKEVINRRKALMTELAKDDLRLMAMYVHGDWMRIFVMKPLRM